MPIILNAEDTVVTRQGEGWAESHANRCRNQLERLLW